MASSSSTSANPNSTRNSSYDVFINAVQSTFATYLYRRLVSYGLNVFLGNQEFKQQGGEYLIPQIEGAIQTACVHVAIFSPGYAQSRWCLDELLMMLESKTILIPVFYNVKPSDLRWTRGNDGVYARALQTLQRKTTYDKKRPCYDSVIVEHWRAVLSDVSLLSGFDLEACNGEGALLDMVVESVLRKVKKTPLNVAKYPTGLWPRTNTHHHNY